eukprot:CAMPEP_0197527868 /NCGR_PEP_ID=MMETSP1318-20131121/23021_1 /TAXON_ID=552666 /ORGANISM="Partenskyella glossopodia, Strain RCC365" /LENGTH=535 /DNA_ID=CAMNT_0043082719 /DNA_START=137 /DNA_END=1740 /DNA_ORIENTATION=-
MTDGGVEMAVWKERKSKNSGSVNFEEKYVKHRQKELEDNKYLPRDSMSEKFGCCCWDDIDCCDDRIDQCCMVVSLRFRHKNLSRRKSKETRIEDEKYKFLLDLLKIRKYWPKVDPDDAEVYESDLWLPCEGTFRRYGAPDGWLEDYMFFLYNNHPLLSIFYSEKLHPYGRYKRCVTELVIQCWCFFSAVWLEIIAYPFLDNHFYPQHNLNFMKIDRFILGLIFITGPCSGLWWSLYGLMACPCLHFRSASRCQHWIKFWGKKCGKMTTYFLIFLPSVGLLYLGISLLVTNWHINEQYNSIWLANWFMFRVIGYILWIIRTMLMLFNWKYSCACCCCYCIGQWKMEKELDMSPTDYWRVVEPGYCMCCKKCNRYPPSLDQFEDIIPSESQRDLYADHLCAQALASRRGGTRGLKPIETGFRHYFGDSDEEDERERYGDALDKDDDEYIVSEISEDAAHTPVECGHLAGPASEDPKGTSGSPPSGLEADNPMSSKQEDQPAAAAFNPPATSQLRRRTFMKGVHRQTFVDTNRLVMPR